jgi:hypothetical protein
MSLRWGVGKREYLSYLFLFFSFFSFFSFLFSFCFFLYSSHYFLTNLLLHVDPSDSRKSENVRHSPESLYLKI